MKDIFAEQDSTFKTGISEDTTSFTVVLENPNEVMSVEFG